MNTIYNLIRIKTESWIKIERENSQSVISDLLSHIEKVGKLRPPQKEAIETYLWIKFIGNNSRIVDMVKSGLLYDDTIAREYENYHTFRGNYTTQFLSQFFLDNDLTTLHRKLVNDPDGEKIPWQNILENLLHNFSYPNYLFSLPMGAGKTYLMACFIYLDLYFSGLFKNDHRFSHNFIVFAPQATKTAILPSLRTIKDFDPAWILPDSEAQKIKQNITIEILDALSSQRKDKLHGNNPNLEKVNRIKQMKDFGLVFITNAEKVVLEQYDADDRIYLDPASAFYDEVKAAEIQKTNELRGSLSQLPKMTVILDEVHHTYGSTGDGEKKLRQAVSILNQHGNINTVLGFSGTPYVKSRIDIEKENSITLNQIQDVVYNYPLNLGIGKFLKIPDIRKANVKESVFIEQALQDFFKEYDKTYKDGSKSKITFYCPSIEKLNESVLPVVKNWYNKKRKGKEAEILRYYTSPSAKKNASGKEKGKIKSYQLPKENLAIFNNLDKPYSQKRVILLVAVGTEGWNCKSLTSVVLPRQKTTKNFVLQTTCRCLREVDDAKNEKALIYLSPDNYTTLDNELRENYRLSIGDLKEKSEQVLTVQVRKPRIGKLKYKQIDYKYRIVKKITPKVKEELNRFSFSYYKQKFAYDSEIVSGQIGRDGLTGETKLKKVDPFELLEIDFNDFLYQLSKNTYGLVSESELLREYPKELEGVHKKITANKKWITLNPYLSLMEIVRDITGCFMDKFETSKEIIENTTEIELLEWQIDNCGISAIAGDGTVYKFMPKLNNTDMRRYLRHPEDMVVDYLSAANNIDPQDISFNYIPYRMDSEFEQNALSEMLKLSELAGLEVYFNGYKNEQLQYFWIQTPRGSYTPDFLILKRKEKKKYSKKDNAVIEKVLIVETKGKPYYDDEFKAKEKFVKEDFLKHNPHFTYHCFVDDGDNDFTKHLDKFKNILKAF
ncbi:MAG: DEAD/DEAH box helicase family protein [Sedimentisphaerales bacterium]